MKEILSLLKKLKFKITVADYNGLYFTHPNYPISVIYLYYTHTLIVEVIDLQSDLEGKHYYGQFTTEFFDVIRYLMNEVDRYN